MAESTNGNTAPDGSPVSLRVTTAVAAALDIDPADLDPLYDILDPEALNALFRERATEVSHPINRVVFMMAGCEVVVDSTGAINVTPPDELSSPARIQNRFNGTHGEARTSTD